MRALGKPVVLVTAGLFLVVAFGRQLGPGLVLVGIAILLGVGWRRLSRPVRRGRARRKTTTRKRTTVDPDIAQAQRQIDLRNAAERAAEQEIKRIQLQQARDAGRRRARIDAGLDPETGRPPRGSTK